jgi:nickel-dependent lactate racemase
LEVLERIQRQGAIGVPWQNQVLARAQLDHKVFLVSGLEPEPVRRMMINPVSSVEEGVSKALAKLGKNAGIAVIPQGPRVMSYVK